MMTLFPEWQARHANDPPQLPKRIRSMHTMYGQREGKICGQCIHLIARRLSNTYFKCDLNTMTNGPGTDWRKRWPACGKFEERT